MRTAIIILLSFLIVASAPRKMRPQSITRVSFNKYVLSPDGSRNATINGGFSPGDTLVIPDVPFDWGGVYLGNLHGRSSQKIVVINEGQVVLNAGFVVESCSYLKLTGAGDTASYKYGYHITRPSMDNAPGVHIRGNSHDIELERTNTDTKGYICWIKNEINDYPCATDSLYWWPVRMYNIKIHDLVADNIGQDGIYFGSSAPKGSPARPSACDGIGHRPTGLANIEIWNIKGSNVGRTLLQGGGADLITDTLKIHNIVGYNIGTEHNIQQGAGIATGSANANVHIWNCSFNKTYKHAVYSFNYGRLLIEDVVADSTGYVDNVTNGEQAPFLVNTFDAGSPIPTTFTIKNCKAGISTDSHGYFFAILNNNSNIGAPNYICNSTILGVPVADKDIYRDGNSGSVTWSYACAGVIPLPTKFKFKIPKGTIINFKRKHP